MGKNKAYNIIKYNAKKNIKNKWFIILNVLIFIVCIIALNFTEIKDFINDNIENKVIEIVDSKNLMYEGLTNKFLNEEKVEIKKVDQLIYNENNFESNRVLIETKYSKENVLEIQIISSERLSDEYYYKIKEVVEDVRSDIYAKQNNISEDSMNIIQDKTCIETKIVEQNDDFFNQFFLYFIVWSITFWGLPLVISTFSKEMFAEKTSKSSEYILTTMSSKEYMIAKIGTTLLNVLLQGILILFYYVIGCLFKFFLTGENLISIININSNIVKILVNVFILYIPYIVVILIIQMIMSSKASDSSSSDSTEKVTSLIMMATNMIPFYLTQHELLKLNIVYYFLSVIPLFSTFTIMSLSCFKYANILHTLIAMSIYIITIIILLKIAPNKIKNGILDYKPSKDKKKEENIKEEKEKEKIKFELKRKLYIEQISQYSMFIGFIIIIYLILAMYILPLIINPIVQGLFENKISQDNISLIASIISGIITLYIPTKIINININNKQETNKSNKSNSKYIMMAIPFLVLIFMIQTIITKKILGKTVVGITENTSYWLVFIRLVIVPAIFEELLFRKAIFNYSKKQGLVFAILISSILFGAIHLNFYQAIGATFAGIVFAIVAYKANSIIPTIILHAMVNSYSFFTNILWINNLVAIKLLNIFVIGMTIIGIVILLENILLTKNKVKKKKIVKEKNSFENSIVKISLLFSNFYFIFAIILLVACFTFNQEYMEMLM